jgi:hypothetical protein
MFEACGKRHIMGMGYEMWLGRDTMMEILALENF